MRLEGLPAAIASPLAHGPPSPTVCSTNLLCMPSFSLFVPISFRQGTAPHAPGPPSLASVLAVLSVL